MKFHFNFKQLLDMQWKKVKQASQSKYSI